MSARRSHHDMGGEPAGKVVPAEHDYEEWERRVDAMAVIFFGIKGKRVISVDEHRRNIEALPPQAYDSMSYYEKWIVALSQCLIQRGVVTSEELGRKMLGKIGPRSHHDMGGEPAGKVRPSEHDYAQWERRVDAMAVLLAKFVKVDQRRRNIEAIAPADYEAMSYYERWVLSLAQSLIQRGLITTDELARKMAKHAG